MFTLLGVVGTVTAIVVIYYILMASIKDKKGIFVET